MTSAVFSAIQAGDADRLADLLQAAASPDEIREDEPRWTALHEAIDRLDDGGPIDAVVLLLRHGADVEGPAYPKMPPLLYAVSQGLEEAARLLLAAGADPNRADDEGDSPLRVAVQRRDYGMVRTLLRAGAKGAIDAGGGTVGMNALGRAAYDLDLPMVELLLEAGADPTARDVDGLTPLERMNFRKDRPEPAWTDVRRLLMGSEEVTS